MEISNAAVQRVLEEEDVEGLLQLGAPSDEYSSEAEMIGARLRALKQSSEEAIVLILADVCAQMFGPFDETQIEVRMPAYRAIARRLLGRP